MKLAIYDPPHNEYVSKMYFAPLEQFARNIGIEVKRIDAPVPEQGWTMLCNAGKITQEIVDHFNDNGCKFAALSCNDSAYLTANIDEFFHRIPLLFTVSGVQKVNFSKQSVMNPDMTVTTRDVQFLPVFQWELYSIMRDAGRLLPLPYVPWDRLEEVPIPAQKTPKILFRGGNHFWRFVAYLHALKNGVAHPASGFLTEDYFREDMVQQFRYCEKCRTERAQNGGRLSWSSGAFHCDCGLGRTDLDEPLKWNNRTPRSFFWLAAELGLDASQMDEVSMALNFRRQTAEQHLRAVADAAFFCDAKWEFSIHTAQRFWEAASVGTVNLLPDRAGDQEYFPETLPGHHFLEFRDDFAGNWHDFEEFYLRQRWEVDGIAQKTKAQYDHWIKPGPNYVTNENLMRRILDRISEVCA